MFIFDVEKNKISFCSQRLSSVQWCQLVGRLEFFLFSQSVSWSVHRFIDWLVSQSVSLLVRWLDSHYVSWSVSKSVGRRVALSVGKLDGPLLGHSLSQSCLLVIQPISKLVSQSVV